MTVFEFTQEWWPISCIVLGLILMHLGKYGGGLKATWKLVLLGLILGILLHPSLVGFWEWMSRGIR